MTFVTYSAASGISATSTRHVRLATMTPGAASHTIRKTGGMFLRAATRSRHRWSDVLGLGNR